MLLYYHVQVEFKVHIIMYIVQVEFILYNCIEKLTGLVAIELFSVFCLLTVYRLNAVQ